MIVTRDGKGLSVTVGSEAETDRLGAALAAVLEPGTILALEGPLGAGKTRLVRAVATALGVDSEAVTSPTFTLIQPYLGRDSRVLYHMDTYRLDDADSFEDLGVGDLWSEPGALSFVEWADRVADRLPTARTWRVVIKPEGPTSRRFTFVESSVSSGWINALAERLA